MVKKPFKLWKAFLLDKHLYLFFYNLNHFMFMIRYLHFIPLTFVTKKELLFMIIFFFTSEIVPAQTTAYEDGFVVLKEGDTLFGQIRDRTEEPFGKLFKKIKFKTKGRWFTKRFAPSDLLAYKKGPHRFESKWIEERFEAFKMTYMSRKGQGEEVFLKVVLQGKLTYYESEWRDPDSGYYRQIPFFQMKNNPELVRVTQGLLGLRRKAVANYLKDDPKLAKRILSGEALSVLDIVKLYNKNQY